MFLNWGVEFSLTLKFTHKNMQCLKCSAENSFQSNFCCVCGYPLTAVFNTVSNARQVERLPFAPAAFCGEQTTVLSPPRLVTQTNEMFVDRSAFRFMKLFLATSLMIGCVLLAVKEAGF